MSDEKPRTMEERAKAAEYNFNVEHEARVEAEAEIERVKNRENMELKAAIKAGLTQAEKYQGIQDENDRLRAQQAATRAEIEYLMEGTLSGDIKGDILLKRLDHIAPSNVLRVVVSDNIDAGLIFTDPSTKSVAYPDGEPVAARHPEGKEFLLVEGRSSDVSDG